jgi:hypothetical protein
MVNRILAMAMMLTCYSITWSQNGSTNGWIYGLEYGGHYGKLQGELYNKAAIADSFKNNLANKVLGFSLGKQEKYNRVHGKIFLGGLGIDDDNDNHIAKGEFGILECGYLLTLKPL